jgi:predicted aldo/keto reductase-like oxidoreductase
VGSPTDRRGFLKRAGALAGVVGVGSIFKYGTQWFLVSPNKPPTLSEPALPDWAGSSIQSYKELGRTGWKMSDISFGTGGLRDPEVLTLALDRGVNYIDTSPDYSDSESERAVGEAVKGRRDKLFIASKFCSPDGHLDKDTPVDKIIEAVEDSLGRLQTDYLDLCHIHAVNSVDRLMAPTFHEAFDRLKEQGKVRFLGVSSHTPELEKVMNHAVDSDRFDVIMVAYNFKNWPDLDNIIAKARAGNVGFVAMKTLKGAYHTVLRDFDAKERGSFPQAAFKWVNANPGVSGLVVTITQAAQVDEYLYASGKPADTEDLALLEKYDRLTSAEYCRPGCGECLDSCPADVAVNDVLRYAMYYDSYGQQREAVRLYEGMIEKKGHGTEVCVGCSAPCENACPQEIPIRNKLVRADRLLRLRCA